MKQQVTVNIMTAGNVIKLVPVLVAMSQNFIFTKTLGNAIGNSW